MIYRLAMSAAEHSHILIRATFGDWTGRVGGADREEEIGGVRVGVAFCALWEEEEALLGFVRVERERYWDGS